MTYAKYHADFITITCLNWKALLLEDRFKDIIISSLSFLSEADRISVYGFVIMSNHLHMIWQAKGDHEREEIQRDFLKFTGQQILKILRNEHSPLYDELIVDSSDRKRQVWERNSKRIPLWSEKFLWQKLEYIHYNPVRAGLCRYPTEYYYSSARFYEMADKTKWKFLVHCSG